MIMLYKLRNRRSAFGVAYLRFETEPGMQAQADWRSLFGLFPKVHGAPSLYMIREQKGQFVFEQQFIDALKNDREMNRIKYGRGIRCPKGRAVTISLSIPVWAMDVETRSLNMYDLVHEHRPVLQEEVAA